jgi:hypothetical protein
MAALLRKDRNVDSTHPVLLGARTETAQQKYTLAYTADRCVIPSG